MVQTLNAHALEQKIGRERDAGDEPGVDDGWTLANMCVDLHVPAEAKLWVVNDMDTSAMSMFAAAYDRFLADLYEDGPQ